MRILIRVLCFIIMFVLSATVLTEAVIQVRSKQHVQQKRHSLKQVSETEQLDSNKLPDIPTVSTAICQYVSDCEISSLIFSRDSKQLIINCGGYRKNDNRIKFLNIADGKITRQLRINASWISNISQTPDGQYLVFNSGDGKIRVWDIAAGKEVREIEVSSDDSFNMALSNDGQFIAVKSADDRTIKLLNFKTGKEIKRIDVSDLGFPQFQFSTNAQRLLIAGPVLSNLQLIAIRIIDIKSGLTIKNTSIRYGYSYEFGSPGYQVIFSPDETRFLKYEIPFAVADIGGLADGVSIKSLYFIRPPGSAAFSHDGRFILTGNTASYGVFGRVGQPLILSEKDRLLTREDICILQLWDAKDGRELMKFRGHKDSIYIVGFSPDDRYIVSGSSDSFNDRIVKVWDLKAHLNR